ncbi:MAG TPA: nuclease-related domain-containing protein [Acidimicrobiales bacterium]|nr:nuclease-related domain-containing protein [Acidimicrobiales bacterium]
MAAAGLALAPPPRAAVAVAVVAAIVALWPSKAGRWAAGAAGERATARALQGIEREGYEVLHDVGLAGRSWNLDHVLLGPAGIVIVESKQWRRPVRVARRHPRIVDERVGWQVAAVAKLLGGRTDVHGFLCVHGAAVRRRWWTGARWAAVGDGRHLRRWLRRLPEVPENGQMARGVFEARR